jgi:pimeloyl-ACP methyl ester carboxylesterase
MPKIDVGGIGVAYELIGDGKKAAVITPGGRFSKDTPGVRELALKLAEGGLRVLIWDRPNCGESDLAFRGKSESILNADTLAGLVRALELEPALLIGGSAGSRVSLLTAIRDPGVAGASVPALDQRGCARARRARLPLLPRSLAAAAMGGMPAVAALPAGRSSSPAIPANRERLLGQDTGTFIQTMKTWAEAFVPAADSPVPGTGAAQLRALKMPTMILRSGESDFHHPRVTSEGVHALIPGSQIAEPPWGDREWLDRLQAQAAGEGLFARWPLLAPQILAFAHA